MLREWLLLLWQGAMTPEERLRQCPAMVLACFVKLALPLC